ncbi:MAG: hypothetical protein K6T59_12920 [Bryobacteraceae bacterium]|nr:hypothetical protein [Bryobacteraceae bacterium]
MKRLGRILVVDDELNIQTSLCGVLSDEGYEADAVGSGQACLEALARGCGRMEWMVLDWNKPARNVYRRLGAEELNSWLLCRMTGEALQQLAKR